MDIDYRFIISKISLSAGIQIIFSIRDLFDFFEIENSFLTLLIFESLMIEDPGDHGHVTIGLGNPHNLGD